MGSSLTFPAIFWKFQNNSYTEDRSESYSEPFAKRSILDVQALACDC